MEGSSQVLLTRTHFLPKNTPPTNMLQFICEGSEYTTRARLLEKYPVPPTTLQYIFERNPQLTKVVDGNKFFYLKSEVEALVEAAIKK